MIHSRSRNFRRSWRKVLCDRERQQNGNDDKERPEIMDKARQVLAAHGVEELAVPLVKPHLPEHVGNGDGDRGNEDRHHAPPAFGPPQHTREQGQVAGKIEILRWRGFDTCVRESRSGRCGRYYRYDRRRGLRQPPRFLRRRVCGLRSEGLIQRPSSFAACRPISGRSIIGLTG